LELGLFLVEPPLYLIPQLTFIINVKNSSSVVLYVMPA
jgi:hypothetical protein